MNEEKFTMPIISEKGITPVCRKTWDEEIVNNPSLRCGWCHKKISYYPGCLSCSQKVNVLDVCPRCNIGMILTAKNEWRREITINRKCNKCGKHYPDRYKDRKFLDVLKNWWGYLWQ